ncbi:MAG: carboxypeptidase-like regulatory domain-containing protein, partial [Bacteroidota bacterium]|nr:carboxypeptidase-like regulatory domain-containing protein [Bacteroidota bacterium]
MPLPFTLRLSLLRWLGLSLLLLPLTTPAQTLRVQVRDSLRHEPLIGASVTVPGTSNGAATDATGTAVLAPAPAAGTRLRVTALGYRPRFVAAPA